MASSHHFGVVSQLSGKLAKALNEGVLGSVFAVTNQQPFGRKLTMKILTRSLTLIGVSAAALAAFALPASAAHESNNHLVFAPVATSANPDASGTGTINYVKGTSGDEPDTEWTSSFRFTGLSVDTTYSVVVKGRFADATAFSEICRFTTNGTGVGSCTSRFTGLKRLAVAQLRMNSSTGAPVLQATRHPIAGGPGSITSSGGCREPEQGGSTCAAPGRI